jgi:4-amino-4-deoxy-L-arabinose transferase-like glycosyltransferase
LVPILKNPERRDFLIALIVLIGVATALRLYGLDRWSLWLDELLQYKESSAPLHQFHKTLFAQDMPLSFIFAHAFIVMGFDADEWQLRLPFAVLGVGTVAMIFLLARELLGQRTAFLAGLAACLMPVLLHYSQEYRAYSLLIFLTTLCGWALAAALRTNQPGWWALFVSAAILSLYTHFVAMFTLVGLAAFAASDIVLKLWQGKPVRAVAWSSLLAFVIVGVAFVPAIPNLARVTGAEAAFLTPHPTSVRLALLPTILLVFPGFERSVATVMAFLAGIGITCSLLRSPRAFLFIFLSFCVPALLYAFYGYERATASPRYTLPLMVPYVVAIGAGLAAIAFGIEALGAYLRPTAKHTGPLATAIVALFYVAASWPSLTHAYASNPKQLPVDLREGFDYLRQKIAPSDLLLEASTSKSGPVYWFGTYESYYLRGGTWPEPPAKGIIDDANFPHIFSQYLDLHGRLWVLMTVADAEQPAVQERSGDGFEVRCFRKICVIRSRHAERPMLEQLGAFFDRFADLDPSYFAASARAVREKIDASPGD